MKEIITVGKLKEYLSCIPDDVKIYVGWGESSDPLRYLINRRGNLILHGSLYGVQAEQNNLETIISFNAKK